MTLKVIKRNQKVFFVTDSEQSAEVLRNAMPIPQNYMFFSIGGYFNAIGLKKFMPLQPKFKI